MSEEIIRRVIRSEIKGISEKDFTVDVVMSDETVDRYREVIKASAWKKRMGNYKAHPILLSSHNYHGLMNQIGDAPKISVKDGALKATFKYYAGQGNPEADWAWVLASKGVAAYSVGFIRHAGRYVDPDADYDDDDELKSLQKAGVCYVYDDVELLECSHVTVPANPSCLQNSFEQSNVMRDLEAKAFPMLAELESELKKLTPISRTRSLEPTEEQKEVEKKKWEDFEKEELRHHIEEPEMFKEGSFRYVTLKTAKPRVRAVVGKTKDEDVIKIQSLRFPKSDDWTITEAKAWVKEHPDVTKSMEEEELIMGIDDLKEMVGELKETFAAEFSEKMKACQDEMIVSFKTSAEDLLKKTLEILDAELEKRKEKEVELVAGTEKSEEIEGVESRNTDGILDVFTSITAEMERTFKVQS